MFNLLFQRYAEEGMDHSMSHDWFLIVGLIWFKVKDAKVYFSIQESHYKSFESLKKLINTKATKQVETRRVVQDSSAD